MQILEQESKHKTSIQQHWTISYNSIRFHKRQHGQCGHNALSILRRGSTLKQSCTLNSHRQVEKFDYRSVENVCTGTPVHMRTCTDQKHDANAATRAKGCWRHNKMQNSLKTSFSELLEMTASAELTCRHS